MILRLIKGMRIQNSLLFPYFISLSFTPISPSPKKYVNSLEMGPFSYVYLLGSQSASFIALSVCTNSASIIHLTKRRKHELRGKSPEYSLSQKLKFKAESCQQNSTQLRNQIFIRENQGHK